MLARNPPGLIAGVIDHAARELPPLLIKYADDVAAIKAAAYFDHARRKQACLALDECAPCPFVNDQGGPHSRRECDPATLARDLKKLLAAGYVIDSIAAFDLFPQTHHVETVVRLRKSC